MPSYRSQQKEMYSDGYVLMRRNDPLRVAPSLVLAQESERVAYRKGIEEIIMESVTERTREYILRRIAEWA